MGIKELFIKSKPFLNENEREELDNIKKLSYMEEAKMIMREKGKDQARKDLLPKPSREKL